jgi:tetratricopeptide (TPR) repeat protein
MKRFLIFVFLFTLTNLSSFAQSERKLNNDGVELYNQKKFSEAELNFRKALEKNQNSFPPRFNLGNSYYKQENYEESIKNYKELLQKTDDKELKSKLYHNIGNSYLKSNKIEQSIEAYKNALKLNPNDQDTKYNLSYALSLLKNNQQQNQKNQNQQNQNDKQDKNQDNQQNKDKENKDKQNQQNQNEQQDKQEQKSQPQQRESKISKEQAERILEALKNNEKDLQKELRKKKGGIIKTDKDW